MDKNKYCQNECVSRVVSSETLNESPNDRIIPKGKCGPLVVKIPVVIAEPRIQVDIESLIKLNEPAIEIKRIKKHVYLTQCKLTAIEKSSSSRFKTGKLFIGGFVRKNIEYATVECMNESTISGDIRHTTANIPFKCVTEVFLENDPVIKAREPSVEIEIHTDKIREQNRCEQKVSGHNPCEQDFIDYEQFTEKIFCELEDVEIYEEDIHRNPDFLGRQFPAEHTFQEITEKMVLYIRLKLLQKQQVYIPGAGPESAEPAATADSRPYEKSWI